MPNGAEFELGPWDPAELLATALEDQGRGADDRLPEQVRFRANVAKLLRKRAASPGADGDPASLAVFLLAATPPDDLQQQLTRIPRLNIGRTPLNGHIWFVSPAVRMGFEVEIVAEDEDALFRFVTDDIRSGSVPAIIYDPSVVKEFSFYLNGLEDPDECIELEIGGGQPVTSEQVFEVIDHLYKQMLITPGGEPRLWRNAGKCWPAEDAEKVVQQNLRAGLAGRFLTCVIRDEQPTPVGRTDLEIEEHDTEDRSSVTRHALLELKVLRSFGSTGTAYPSGKTLEWIDDGVRQAHEYGIEKGSRFAALCCFDMRTADNGDECLDQVREKAAAYPVLLKRWYLYNSPEQYRRAASP